MASMSNGTRYMEHIPVVCMACTDDTCNFEAMNLQRRKMGAEDVVIEMKYCGVCHSDLHFAAGHLKKVLGPVEYPMVPGHELAGVCVAVGEKVTKFRVGQHVGVGCMIDSCGKCKACKAGEEQMCMQHVSTYNGKDPHGRAAQVPVGRRSLGGYTTTMVVHQNFGILIPESYPLEYAGPVMCAGVTMFDPLRRQGAKEGTRVGIVGLGGLGQMGLRIAKALGCVVTAISRSKSKEAYARQCGAESFIASGDPESFAAGAGSLDLILNTVPTYHDYLAYNSLLSKSGKQVMLGLHKGLMASMLVAGVVGPKNSRVISSGIGSIEATQAVIDLCDRHKIYPAVEVVPCSSLNSVYEKLDSSNETGVRYVLDIANTLKEDVVCPDPAPKLHPFDPPSYGSVFCEFLRVFCCCRWC